MKIIVIICFLLNLSIYAAQPGGNLPNQGVMGKVGGEIFDPSIDFAHQTARVSDIDDGRTIFKLNFENNNIKFLKSGDIFKFRILNNSKDMCQAQVRKVEDFFVTVEIATLAPCWKSTEYFRRGTILEVDMPVLEQRVYEASNYRKTLVQKRVDFLNQLKELNNFLYNYDQEKVKLIVEYDERMARLMEEKKKAVRALMAKRKESYSLRQKLKKELDKADNQLDFYRIERQEPLVDRWHLSRDLGIPTSKRPQGQKQEFKAKK